MTLRSTQPHHPKTTAISRRPRDSADQHLSIQPSEIPQIRSARPRRAATLPTPRHNPIDYQSPNSRPPSLAWNTSHTLDSNPPCNNSLAISVEQDPSHSLLPVQTLDFLSHDSPQGSDTGLGAITGHYPSHTQQSQHIESLGLLASPLTSASGSHEFDVQLSADSGQPHGSFFALQDMSTLGFMMAPSQYGMSHYGNPQSSYSNGYPPQQSYAEPRSSTSGPYGSSYSSSPAPNESQQSRPEQHAALPPYQPQHPSLPRSPYQQQQSADSIRANNAPMASASHSYTYSAPQNNSFPNQPLGNNNYPPPQLYPPTTYGVNDYHPLPTMYPPTATTPSAYASYDTQQSAPPPNGPVPALSSSPSTQGNSVMPRVLNSRPKPQCWEHGCNGRQFSTFSNLLRHQREKSGTASKSSCPRCGAEFTRTTARNGHMAHDKCKPRRASEAGG
ncbi:PAT1 domain containing protein [Pyrenophora tritici-repentis]|nr:PAT1 domain containing protein [Pyrenophora tritici-repentis]